MNQTTHTSRGCVQIKKQLFVVIPILLGLFLCACSGNSTELPEQLSPSPTIPSEHSASPSAAFPADSSQEVGAVINGRFYETTSDFLNSVDGVAFQDLAFRAAKAWLSSDMDTLRQYYANPEEFELYYGSSDDLTDRYLEVETFIIKWSFDSVQSEDTVGMDYQLMYAGWDSYMYVTMYLVMTEDGWKVDWIGGQG